MAKRRKSRKPKRKVQLRPAPKEQASKAKKSSKAPVRSTPAFSSGIARLILVAGGVAALVVYIFTLAPSVPVGDSGELISAAYVGGVAHPPGYPLFVMIGWAATHAWPGSPAVAMNLLSALFQAGTVVLVSLLTARIVSPRWPRSDLRGSVAVAGVAGGLALAFSTAFWLYALVAEVFALNDLFAAALLMLAVEWYRDRSKVWALILLGLVSGLGAAHQQTIVLLAPALVVLLVAGIRADGQVAHVKRRRARRILRQVKKWHFVAGAAMIGVGLLAYAWLPFAASTDPVVNFGDPETPERFIDVVTRGPYGSTSLIPGGERGSLTENMGLYGEYLVRAFTPLGILLAVGGGIWLFRWRRVEAWALLLAFVFTGPSFIAFANAPLDSEVTKGIVERFYILSGIPLAVAIGVGVYAIVAWLRDRRGLSERILAIAAGTVVVALVATLAVFRWPNVDQSDNRVAENYGTDILARLEPDALLLTRGDHNFTSVTYAQVVDGQRPDVIMLDVELLKLDSYVAEQRDRHPDLVIPFTAYDEETTALVELVEANLDRRPAYALGPLNEIEDLLTEERRGLVRRLWPAGVADEHRALLADRTYVTELRFPDPGWPETTWESVIARAYGNVAHSLGFALHETTPTADDPLVVEMYRLGITIGDIAASYKNLGLFYWERDGDPAEIIDLWETYLEFEPDDPQVEDIRRALDQLRAGS